MRGILITPYGEIGTEGAAIFIPRHSIPGLLRWSCFNVTFLWFLRHFASDCDPGPPQVWSLHWADVTVSALCSANHRRVFTTTDQWEARIRPALNCLMSVNFVWQWRAWQRSLQPGQNTVNVTNKAAQTANKWQSISFYLLHISYKLSHLFNSPCEDPAAGSGWLITADDWVNEAETPGHPDQLSLSPMMISR